MAVTFDAKATADTSGNSVAGATGLTNSNLTVGNGSNRALLALACFGAVASSIGTVTPVWDSGGTNQSPTKIISGDAPAAGVTPSAWLFGLVAPTSGPKTFKMTWSGSAADVYLMLIAFAGVDQTGGATTFPNSVSDPLTTTSTAAIGPTVTSANGDAVVACFASNVELAASVNNNQIFIDDTDNTFNGAGNYALSSGASVAMTAVPTGATSTQWAIVATDILAAAGGGGGGNVPFNPWPQLGPMLAQKRKGFVGWDVLHDHRRKVLRPCRGLFVPRRSLILPCQKKAA